MSPLARRLMEVRARVDAACEAAGRDPGDVGLIAVSKTKPLDDVLAACAVGHRDFGENYARGLRDKQRACDVSDLRWHYIGQIQSNKAGIIASAFRVHALEQVRHAQALVKKASPTGVDALVAVNIGGEESKGGVPPEALLERVRALTAVDGLRVRGLMCLPPFHPDPEEVAPYFQRMAALLETCRADGHEMRELSMGMSHDFHVAVRHGATWVRVGTAIFGARGR